MPDDIQLMVEALSERMRNADWHYANSDDASVYERGARERSEILKDLGTLASVDLETARDLWDQHARGERHPPFLQLESDALALQPTDETPRYEVRGFDPSGESEISLGHFDRLEDAYPVFMEAIKTTSPKILNGDSVVIATTDYEWGHPENRFPQFLDEALKAIHDEATRKREPEQDPQPSNHSAYHELVAGKIIEQLEKGTAPWLKPWKPGELTFPHNPVSGTRYKGANLLYLCAEAATRGYDDPRWMTYRQAQQLDAQVRRGEKGTSIQYWKMHERVPLLDEEGNPVLDKEGKPMKREVPLDRPSVFRAVVFNASQIEGLPPAVARAPEWDPVERAETMVANSRATLRHDQANRAFYSVATDSIHLPHRSQFDSAEGYYETALHELAHWTGHESRLNRDIRHPFGSAGYAKEELRAEIASLMLGEELGIGHDPGNHAAYVQSWIKALRDDPKEIFRAAAAAEKIMTYIFQLEIQKERGLAMEETSEVGSNIAQENTYLAVPYAQKDAAKALGARWDKTAKSWYAPQGLELDPFAKWLPHNAPKRERGRSPQEEFAEALKNAGLILDELPVMDGEWHRVPAIGDKNGKQSGAYKGHLDGRPAGTVQNFRSGYRANWKQSSVHLDPEEKARLLAEVAQKRLARDAELEARHEKKSQECTERFHKLPEASGDHPYLVRKGVASYDLRMNEYGDLIVPLRDVNGKLWSLQRIKETGEKPYEKDARKEGCFHVIGGEDAFQATQEILITEGYATGASVHMALEKPVVVAFDSGNLQAVAETLRNAYPDKSIVILGDDDRHLPERSQPLPNAGREKALKAAKAVGGRAVFPTFLAKEKGSNFTDFNDLHRVRGLDTVKRQIQTALGRDKQKQLRREKTEERTVDKERRPEEIQRSVGLGF